MVPPSINICKKVRRASGDSDKATKQTLLKRSKWLTGRTMRIYWGFDKRRRDREIMG